ncbi:MAG: phytanoyl-CoA dioxygenase family protein [Armatimonadetes bacterium]|nr:phytanoyl-CoA dioxygenase family protein [Armatimonadota bacterium]
MLTPEQIRSFHENGYLNESIRVLTDEQLERLRDRLDAVIEGKSEAPPEALRNMSGGGLKSDRVVVQIVNIWQADDLFRAHLCNPVILEMMAQLMDTDTIRVWHDQIQYKPPVIGTSTNWHQDYPAWPILEPADLISCWVALDDATLENGCMRMVPGSHKWGTHRALGTGEEFAPTYDPSQLPEDAEVKVVPIEVPAGCAAFHHSLTWHGSAPNPSQRHRRAIAVHYMPGHTRYVPNGTHLIQNRVEVEAGEILTGQYFPTVYENGRPLPPEAIKSPSGPAPTHNEFLDLSYTKEPIH